jgi:hypothetical protein
MRYSPSTVGSRRYFAPAVPQLTPPDANLRTLFISQSARIVARCHDPPPVDSSGSPQKGKFRPLVLGQIQTAAENALWRQVGSEARQVAPTLNQRTQPSSRKRPHPLACFANRRSEQTPRHSAIAAVTSAKFAASDLRPHQPYAGMHIEGPHPRRCEYGAGVLRNDSDLRRRSAIEPVIGHVMIAWLWSPAAACPRAPPWLRPWCGGTASRTENRRGFRLA